MAFWSCCSDTPFVFFAVGIPRLNGIFLLSSEVGDGTVAINCEVVNYLYESKSRHTTPPLKATPPRTVSYIPPPYSSRWWHWVQHNRHSSNSSCEVMYRRFLLWAKDS